MTETNPTSLDQLDKKELYRSALEDFALQVDEEHKDNKDVLLAAFFEGGVDWAQYVAMHPEVKPAEPAVVVEPTDPVPADRVPEKNRGNVISSKDMNASPQESLTVDTEPVVVRTKEAPVYSPNDRLLIKMEGRDNPMFHIAGYKFTSEAPYNLVEPVAAERILREPGFRQAFPSEVQEFYG